MNYPDRKHQPELKPVVISNLLQPEAIRLDNGITVYLMNAGNEDITRLEFHFNAGMVMEKRPLVASAANMMLYEGSENYSAAELNKRLDFFGTQPSNYIEKESAGFSILFLNRYTGDVLNLAQEILFRPLFPEEELDSLMKKRLQWHIVNREKVNVLASDRFNELVFGSDHPYGRATKIDDFSGVSRDMLKEFHSTFYMPGGMTIFAAGRIESRAITLINKYFGTLPADKPLPADIIPLPDCEDNKADRVLKKGALQSAIRIGSRTIDKRHPDYFGLKILDTILGGYFGSRLMKNIREEKGFTYGIQSTVKSYGLSGYKSISAEVGATNTREAIDEIYKEIKKLHEEAVPPAELEAVRNYMLGELVRMFDGPFATMESFRSAWEFGMDNSYYQRFSDMINSITADEIIRIAQTYYRIDDLVEVIAGPE